MASETELRRGLLEIGKTAREEIHGSSFSSHFLVNSKEQLLLLFLFPQQSNH